MSKGFKKGDLVTHLCDYDGKGTVAYVDAVVYSCGKKQMVLTDAETGEEIGRHFDPVTGADRSYSFRSVTVPRLTNDEAVKAALEMAEETLEKRRAWIAKRSDAWTAQVAKAELDKLHEPRALRYCHSGVTKNKER